MMGVHDKERKPGHCGGISSGTQGQGWLEPRSSHLVGGLLGSNTTTTVTATG